MQCQFLRSHPRQPSPLVTHEINVQRMQRDIADTANLAECDMEPLEVQYKRQTFQLS